MKINPLVSILVPVYNTKKYLVKCVNSILSQTYKNIEIILVDDGSKDGSGELCDYLAKSDNRIRALHQNNKGALFARYLALSKSHGEYIVWVDSDDYIDESYIELLVDSALGSDVDLVSCSIYFEIGDERKKINGTIEPGVYKPQEIKEKMLFSGNFFEQGILPQGVTKLYKRKMLEYFMREVPSGIAIGEDAAVIYPYILKSSKIYISDEAGYHYVQRQDSAMKIKNDNDICNINLLCAHLGRYFDKDDCLMAQLNVYKNYLYMLRDISYFDKDNYLGLYGGIKDSEKVIIYGAGGMGHNIYEYCLGKRIEVAAWIDKNYIYYQKINKNILSYGDFENKQIDFDRVIIAVLNERIANDIRNYLLSKGIGNEKIRYISNEFTRISI